MYGTISNTPVALLVFVATIFISHYVLDRDHYMLDQRLQALHAWISDTWAPLRLFFGALLFAVKLLADLLKMLMSLQFLRSLLPQSPDDWMLHPWSVAYQRKYHLLVTHGFIHANYIHLALNMIVFWFFAFVLEWKVGSLNFFLIYFGSLIISAAISAARRKDNPGFRSLGASGALSGVLFGFILYYPNTTLLAFFIIPVKAWIFAVLFVAISYYAGKNRFAFIDHEGHLWGALSGAAITILLDPGVLPIFFKQIFA